MATRYYDRILNCGCMISSDSGGGLMPCCYDDSDKKQLKKCNDAWEKWRKTKDYQKHLREVEERN